MLNSPFSPWPCYTDEEADAVSRVLKSNRVNYWTGDECSKFENEFADFCKSKFAIAVSNGTTALELSLRALGVGVGDEVIVSPRTFIASVSCIVNVGATPIFADVDLDSQNITISSISAVLSKKTKAVICVHLAGWPCDMDAILDLANTNNFFVVEDCAQAHGARYKGRPVGSLGHIAAWSFCQDKIMTTGGEGGMVTTNDRELSELVWSLKDHGKSALLMNNAKHELGRWVHERIGTNARMTEMQAVVGRIQLKRMRHWHSKRTTNALSLYSSIKSLDVARTPHPGSDIDHAWYKAYIFVDPGRLKSNWTRDRILSSVVECGVPCFEGICGEVYKENAFKCLGEKINLKNARQLGNQSLMFLVHPTLTATEIDKACEVVSSVLERAADC